MHGEDEAAHHNVFRGGERALQDEIERLQSELAEKEGRLERERKRFDHELLQARRELAQARVIQESLAEQVHRYRGRQEPALAVSEVSRPVSMLERSLLLHRIWRWMISSKSERELQQHVALVRQSGLFDVDWYLTEYPDVADVGMDPVEHYLRFGAVEGRDPSSLFRTDEYMRDHPELADGRINPLVHFLQSQQFAGR